MADLKTYTCDYKNCGKHGSTRFSLETDQWTIDPGSGKRDYEVVDIDLCVSHMIAIFNKLIHKHIKSTESVKFIKEITG